MSSSTCCTMARKGGARYCGVCGGDTATGSKPGLRAFHGSVARFGALAVGLACLPAAAWLGGEARGAAKREVAVAAPAPPVVEVSSGAADDASGAPARREGDANERVSELLAEWRAPAKTLTPTPTPGSAPAVEPSANPPTPLGAVSTPVNVNVNVNVNVKLTPTGATASSQSSSRRVSYYPLNVIDGDPGTAWQVSGAGPGEWIELSFGHAVTMARLGVVTGYDKVMPDSVGDRWPLNNRLADVEIMVEGRTITHHFADSRPMQWVELGGAATSWVRIRVITVYTGARWYDTAISEVQAEGVP